MKATKFILSILIFILLVLIVLNLAAYYLIGFPFEVDLATSFLVASLFMSYIPEPKNETS